MSSTDAIQTLLTASDIPLSGPGATATEFFTLLKCALGDEDAGIRDAGGLIAMALREKARGWLTQEDLIVLLEGQRDIARLRANNAEIALRNRIQSITIRLLDIILASLIAAL